MMIEWDYDFCGLRCIYMRARLALETILFNSLCLREEETESSLEVVSCPWFT